MAIFDTIVTAIIGAIAGFVPAIFPYIVSRKRISEKEMFVIWRMAFDRPAFKGRYLPYTGSELFVQAIKDIIRAIDTGVLKITANSDEKGKGKTYLKNRKWLSMMDDIENRLQKIVYIVEEVQRNPPNDDERKKAGEKIDIERDEIIKEFNEILVALKIPVLPMPTECKVDFY